MSHAICNVVLSMMTLILHKKVLSTQLNAYPLAPFLQNLPFHDTFKVDCFDIFSSRLHPSHLNQLSCGLTNYPYRQLVDYLSSVIGMLVVNWRVIIECIASIEVFPYILARHLFKDEITTWMAIGIVSNIDYLVFKNHNFSTFRYQN